ncbi:MAG: HAD family hydrolase [Syntrophaceae bacterium]|nr:HAD family hydrolase [Syntrophaceae bacterium]
MLKCVIFDLDGTIADTLPLCIAAFRQAVEPILGKSVSDNEIAATFGPSEEGTIQAFIPDFFAEGLSNYLKSYRQLHDMCKQPFDGIIDLLTALKERGLMLALVTGKGINSLDISLEFFGISKYFDAIETGSPKGPSKPAGMYKVLNKLGLRPHEAIYIGDAPNDIVSAREVSIPVIAAAWAETANASELESYKPDKICYSIAELHDYLMKIIGVAVD